MPLAATVPVPSPERTTVSRFDANVAVTLLAASIVTVQVPVPVHAPLQPMNAFLLTGVAVSTTIELPVKLAEHVPLLEVQLEMPAGFESTSPLPVTLTVSVRGRRANVAVTARACDMVVTHGPVPVHAPPDQPENVESSAAVANSVTTVLAT